jgi:hypothetical protein
MWAEIPQSVYRLAMGWAVRGSNPGGGRYSAPVLTDPGAHLGSYTMDTGSFPMVKWPGRGVNHTHTHTYCRSYRKSRAIHLLPSVRSWNVII